LLRRLTTAPLRALGLLDHELAARTFVYAFAAA
jgi:hypothetical protein